MKINIDTKIKITPIIITMIVISATLLPIQASIMYAFNLPTLFQLLYPFLIVSFIIILNIPIKKILSSLDYKFLFLFLLLILFQIISSMINSTTIIDFSMKFSNYVLNYSKLLDSPIPRMINWSIFRPFLFFCYILTLCIFLNFKNGIKIHTKSLICLGLLSIIYSIYQIVAAYLGLPFGAIFSGHNGQEIFLLGNIRRVEGLFFESGNVEQLKECILTYWNNPKLVIEHGKNGYKKVVNYYNEKNYYEKLILVYKDSLCI